MVKPWLEPAGIDGSTLFELAKIHELNRSQTSVRPFDLNKRSDHFAFARTFEQPDLYR